MPKPKNTITTRSGRVVRPPQRYTPEPFEHENRIFNVRREREPYDPRDDWISTGGTGYWSPNEDYERIVFYDRD